MAAGDNTYQNSDGDAIPVTLSSAVVKNQVAYVQGWLGVAAGNGGSGDGIALEIEDVEYQFVVPGSLSVAKGDIVFVDVVAGLTGHIPGNYYTASGSNRIRLFKATSAKDSNNVVTGILLSGSHLS